MSKTFLQSNGCSIVAIASRKQKLTRMYFFLLHLSIADILTAFSSLLPELVNSFSLRVNP
jgi:arginine vasopressin receptor 1A